MTWTRFVRGHGLSCLLLGCRYPSWHGRNYRPPVCPDDAPGGICWDCGAGRFEPHKETCPIARRPHP